MMPPLGSAGGGLLAMLFCTGGTGAGCLLAYLWGRRQPGAVPLLITTAAGMLLVMILLHIVPESMGLGGAAATVLGLGGGGLAAMALDAFIHRRHRQQDSGLPAPGHAHGALLLSAALALHNFPTGLALGGTLEQAPHVAHSLSWALALHSVPEGIALGLPFALSRRSPLQLAALTLLISSPTLLGAVLGESFGLMTPALLSSLLGAAAGTLLYVVIIEFILPSLEKTKLKPGLTALFAGAALGVLSLLGAS